MSLESASYPLTAEGPCQPTWDEQERTHHREYGITDLKEGKAPCRRVPVSAHSSLSVSRLPPFSSLLKQEAGSDTQRSNFVAEFAPWSQHSQASSTSLYSALFKFSSQRMPTATSLRMRKLAGGPLVCIGLTTLASLPHTHTHTHSRHSVAAILG